MTIRPFDGAAAFIFFGFLYVYFFNRVIDSIL